ncbi:MAG: PaaI family thioesterase [Solirubrobacterales bacterium]
MSYLGDILKTVGREELVPIAENTVSNCFEFMKPTLVEYKQNQSMTIKFPVQQVYLNPNKAMQGGFISAAFDNVFGLLCFLSSEKHSLSLDLNTSFLRPIYAGEEVTIKVSITHLGGTIVHMRGDAYSNSGEIAAVADTKLIFPK